MIFSNEGPMRIVLMDQEFQWDELGFDSHLIDEIEMYVKMFGT